MLVFAFTVLCLLTSAYAHIMRATVHEIHESRDASEEHMIFMETGHVVFVHPSEKRIFSQVKKHFNAGLEMEFRSSDSSGPSDFSPVPSETMRNIFVSMNPGWSPKSQCYDRAHVWSYEAHLNNVEMRKFFIFFTRKYIREYKFPWWFHVAPVMSEDDEKFVMDRTFSNYPLTTQSWIKLFVQSGDSCPKIENYSTYSTNKLNRDCYLIETSKYIKHPSQIKNKVKRNKFVMKEVRNSYRKGFHQQETLLP